MTKNAPYNEPPTTWAAAALDWLATLFTNRAQALCIEDDLQPTQRAYIWGQDSITWQPKAPPAWRLTFTDPESFAQAAVDEFARFGKCSQPASINLGEHQATFTTDEFNQRLLVLTYALAPAFELLQELERSASFRPHREAFDLVRLQLANLLPPETTATLAKATWQITSTATRELGAARDKGIREFASQQTVDPALAPLSERPYPLTVPVFVFTTPAGLVEITAPLLFEISAQHDGEQTSYRLAPVRGQTRLARAHALTQLAALITKAATAAATETGSAGPLVVLATHTIGDGFKQR